MAALLDRLRCQLLIRRLPLRSAIFLPTERIPPDAALEGLKRVQALYRHDLDKLHRPRLRALREKHRQDDRCFVIGNGPSLNSMDLEKLSGEVTFAVNGFFLKAASLSWHPTYYVVEDHLVAEDRQEEIAAFSGPTKLFPANLAYCLPQAEDTIFFDHRPRLSFPDGFDFSLQADQVTYTGCTVTFTCLQLAAYLGFSNIYLIGVDANYSIPSDARRSNTDGVAVLDMNSDDENHFDGNYFGKGYRWHDPQVEKMLLAYEEARKVTSEAGIQVLNAGVGGELEVFPRVDFDSLFA